MNPDLNSATIDTMKDKLNQPISITITAGTIFKTILIFILFYFIFILRDLVLILLTSIVIASAIEPGTRWFMKKKLPRTVSVLLVYLVIIGILIGIFYVFVPPLIDDVRDLTKTLPDYVNSINTHESFGGETALDTLFNNFLADFSTSEIVSKVTSTVSGATFGVLNTASFIFGGVMSLLLIVVISFYLAAQEDGVRDFLHVITPKPQEKYVVDLWKRSQKKIGLWMQGQLLLAFIIGLLTYLGLSILGVSNAMFLAVIAALFELIPIFGPILAAIPAIAFAFFDGGATLALMTLGLYGILQQFESQLIHPLVVKKIVGIPSLVAILALIVGAKIAGFLGIILSVPIAAVIMEMVNDLEKKRMAEDR